MQQLFATEIPEQTYLTDAELRDLPLFEYLLVISPYGDLWDEIRKIKKEFARKYNFPLAYSTKPHITLANFVQMPHMKEKLQFELHKIAATQPAFEIDLQDYGSFPSRTIYINVTSKDPIIDLIEALKSAKHLMTPPIKKYGPHFTSIPHLTIARSMQEWRYEKAWFDYQYKSFSGRFTASHITLLRKHVSEKEYDLVGTYELLGQDSNRLKQGMLF